MAHACCVALTCARRHAHADVSHTPIPGFGGRFKLEARGRGGGGSKVDTGGGGCAPAEVGHHRVSGTRALHQTFTFGRMDVPVVMRMFRRGVCDGASVEPAIDAFWCFAARARRLIHFPPAPGCRVVGERSLTSVQLQPSTPHCNPAHWGQLAGTATRCSASPCTAAA